MRLDLYRYAMDWATAVGHELEGITTEEVMEEVNANLPDDTDAITFDEADTIRRIIEDALAQ